MADDTRRPAIIQNVISHNQSGGITAHTVAYYVVHGADAIGWTTNGGKVLCDFEAPPVAAITIGIKDGYSSYVWELTNVLPTKIGAVLVFRLSVGAEGPMFPDRSRKYVGSSTVMGSSAELPAVFLTPRLCIEPNMSSRVVIKIVGALDRSPKVITFESHCFNDAGEFATHHGSAALIPSNEPVTGVCVYMSDGNVRARSRLIGLGSP